MSNAKRCDACNKLYVPGTDEDMVNRPIIRSSSSTRKKRFTGFKLFSGDDVMGYKDLCPDCAQKVADQFVNTDVFEKEAVVPEDPSTEEPDNPDPSDEKDDISDNNEEKENE